MSGTLCKLCNQRLATITISELGENDQPKRLSCCHHCLNRLAVDLNEVPPSIADILARNDDNRETTIEPLAKQPFQPPSSADDLNRSCPDCGLTWGEFLERNRFGCPKDVEVFADLLVSPLMELHGNNHHQGITDDNLALLQAAQRRQQELDKLSQELNEALAVEAFEQAAQLRDRIRALKAEADS